MVRTYSVQNPVKTPIVQNGAYISTRDAYTITDGSTEGNSNICNIENQVGAVGFINVLFPEFIIDKL